MRHLLLDPLLGSCLLEIPDGSAQDTMSLLLLEDQHVIDESQLDSTIGGY